MLAATLPVAPATARTGLSLPAWAADALKPRVAREFPAGVPLATRLLTRSRHGNSLARAARTIHAVELIGSYSVVSSRSATVHGVEIEIDGAAHEIPCRTAGEAARIAANVRYGLAGIFGDVASMLSR